MADSSNILGLIEKQHILSLLKEKKRLDGRSELDYRQVSFEIGTIKKAEGSAIVHLGDTTVLAGVKCELGTPFKDTSNSGVLIVNIERSPMASPTFRSGPPRAEAIELARVIDRGIREAKVIDVDNLCIVPGEKVWIIFVDIYVLDAHGNLFDASTLAAMAALATTKLPSTIIGENGEIVVDKENSKDLPIQRYTSSTTFYKLQDHLIVDPLTKEEYIGNARFTIAITEEGNVCAIQKGLFGSFSKDEIDNLIDVGKEKAMNNIKLVKEAVNEYKKN